MARSPTNELTARYRACSLWLDGALASFAPRPPLPGDRECDVVVIGAGLTGLWTAYGLAAHDPRLRVIVLEAKTAGYGASGRNGGFVSAGIAGEAEVYARRAGMDGVRRAERAMIDGIDWIGGVVADEGIDCGWMRTGALRVATSRPQLERVREGVAAKHARGYGEDEFRLLSAGEVAGEVRIEGVVGGSFTPHCARVDPARLVRGLAVACERRGVTIHEGTRAVAIAPGQVLCETGTVLASVVVRATEAYTTLLPGERRRYLTLTSHMVATEPLGADVWAEIGWTRCQPFADQRFHFVYGQRTEDGRIALGGRGLSYRLGSVIGESGEHRTAAHERLQAHLGRLFPAAAAAPVSHRWSGTFAAPRDWSMGVGFDRGTGIAWAGGYSGHGVVASSLAGRTLADLITGRESELTALPWVGHESPRWEREPLRWLATRTISAVLESADRAEDRTGRPARRARLVSRWTPGR
jgi:glycine/D-amino acid oxidase-like deaminating enzyme